MAVTGTNTFIVTRDDVIKAALRTLNVIGMGDTVQPEDYTNCSQALNLMIKSWSLKGIPLWVTTQVSFPLLPNQANYPVGTLGGQLVNDSFILTNGGSGGVDGTYALTFTDASGTGATGTYTVAGGTVTGFTITAAGSKYVAPTITAGSFALSGVTGVVYEIKPLGLYTSRPLSCSEGSIKSSLTNTSVLLNEISRVDYVNLANKNTQAQPVQYYFDAQIETSFVRFTTIPTKRNWTFIGQVQRQFYDMTSGTDNFDFPQAWFNALKWGLVAELAVEYNVNQELLPYFEQKATQMVSDAFYESVEETSVYFTMRDY